MKTNKNITVVSAAACLIIGTLIVVIIAGLSIPEKEETIEGEADVTDYRVSSKVPARVKEFYVQEGDFVHKGDTLVRMEAPDIQAKLSQAESATQAAQAQDEKAMNGTRYEQVQSARNMWEKAKAGLIVAQRTYGRVKSLFEQGVMAEQKLDEAKAQYDAAVATEKAAHSQYDMAVNGARKEDKAAAKANLNRAKGAVSEVNSYIDETVLTASADGYVTEIFPEVGELVGTGAPIMNVDCINSAWFVFNIREDMMTNLKLGTTTKVYVPALDKTIPVKITLIKNVGNFAAWKATKAMNGYDLKTFEVQAHPINASDAHDVRVGMTAIMKQKPHDDVDIDKKLG